MNRLKVSISVMVFIILFGVGSIRAQQSDAPRFIQFNGVLKTSTGQPRTGAQSINLSVYSDQNGGAVLWSENQTVMADEEGRFGVLLGAGSGKGIPADLFSSADFRWLGTQANVPGETEAPRAFISSVASALYADNAGNAATLGGIPYYRFRLIDDVPSSANKLVPANGETNKSAISADTEVNVSSATTIPGQFYVTDGPTTFSLLDGGGTGATLAMNNADASKQWSLRVGDDGTFNFRDDATGRARLKLDNSGALRSEAEGAQNAVLRLDSNMGRSLVNDFGGIDFRFDRVGFGPDMGFAGIRAIRRDVGYADNGTDLAFYTGTGGVDAFTTERLRIAKNGNVGIGTASPTTKLDVIGTIKGTAIQGDGALLTAVNAANVTCTSCISTAEIDDSGITTAKIANLAVTTAKIADGAITNAKIAAGAIVDANISASAAIGSSKLSDAARTRGITYLAGCDTCSVLADTDDQLTIYYNVVGSMDFVSVVCFADTGSPTINIQKVVGAGGPVDILPAPLTCNGTATTTFSVASMAKTDKVNFVMVTAGGTAKRVTLAIEARTNN